MTKDTRAAGYVGQITANSFMKREFGKKLIEGWLPQVDLTHVIDTSGAYIPGHGTPTVILFGRNRKPVADTIRTVMGIRGEPSTPDDPSQGLVWSAIVQQIDRRGSQSEFVSVGDSQRELFQKHPWSIGGGGAAELKEQLEEGARELLSKLTDSIGITSFTLEDDIYILPERAARRSGLRTVDFRIMVVGDALRDWMQAECEIAIFPYDAEFRPIENDPADPSQRYLWIARSCLSNNKMFGGKSKVECGLKWYEYGRLTSDKLRTPLSITYAEVATHNHFVLDRGGKVFNRTAPVIKLSAEAAEDDHLALLGLLNSSTACFWMKQVCHNKGSTVDQHGARQRTDPFEDFFAFNATKLQQFPLPAVRPLEQARRLDHLARELQGTTPGAILTARREDAKGDGTDALSAFAPLRELLTAAHARYDRLRGQMISLQEELDWTCYQLYERVTGHCSLVTGSETNDQGPMTKDHSTNDLPALVLGQRAFEIVLARRMAAGELQTTWFERHGSTPMTDLPADWPDDYRRLVERRIELIESDRNIGLIEQPEYKRRWNTEPWESQCERALREYLLDRLESYFDFDGRMSLVAAQTNQTLYLHGAPYDATLSNVPDACELRKDKLPDEADWELALSRAGTIFGVAGSRLLSGGNANSLAAGCKKKAAEVRKACHAYAERLKQRMTGLGMTPDTTDRMQTAAATQRIVDQLSTAEQGAIIGLLAKAAIATSETAMGECVSKAAELEGNLDTAGWQTFELIKKLPDEHQSTAQAILTDLKESLGKDEHVAELAPVLKSAQVQTMRLLEKVVEKKPVTPPSHTPTQVTPPPIKPPAAPLPPPGWVLVDEGIADGLDLSKAKDKLAALESRLRADRRIHVQISWRVEEKRG